MSTGKRNKMVLTLVAVAMVVLAIGQVQAELIDVPNGTFQMYKPGTGYTVLAVFTDGHAKGFGDNLTVLGAGIAGYGDGTSGGTVDCPGWIWLVKTGDLTQTGVDGSTAYNAFGTWSGGTGNLAESADSLGDLAAGRIYTISAMINGPARPLVFELSAGGAALTPSSSVTPVAPGDWTEISRTYEATTVGDFGQPMKILLGTRAVPPEVYEGTRVRFDNVMLDVENPMNPFPDYGELIKPPGDVELSWTNWPGIDANDVYVDVWFGTEPTAMTLAVDAGLNTTSVIVDAGGDPETYYWEVISYLNGEDNINDANAFRWITWTFTTTTDLPPESIDAGLDVITWSGQGVQLDATAVDDGTSALTYLWTADPPHGVVFDSDSIEDPIVTFTNRILVRGVQAETDDAEEYINAPPEVSGRDQGEMKFLTDTDLEMGSESGNSGLRWQVIAVQYHTLSIPQGSTINSAKITFEVQNSGQEWDSNDFTILAEAADDASVFTEDPNNITDRARSTASVAWAPDALPAVGSKVETPDITTLIQEVVNREGWSDNNRLTLMIYPDVYLASPTGGTTTVQEIEFEGGPGADAPTLSVTYESPAGSAPLADASTFTITVAVSDEFNPTPLEDTLEIDVYDNPCDAAILGLSLDADNPVDYNKDCIPNLKDAAIMASNWAVDNSLTEPIAKPE